MSRSEVHALVCGDLNLLRCLTGRGFPVAVVASDPREPTLRSRHAGEKFVIASPVDAERAVVDLEALAQRFAKRPVLYYGNDATLLLLSRARERLGKGFRFSLPPSELVEALVDKARFSELARLRRLRIPETVHSEQLSSARELLAEVGVPCAFKPNNHTGWLSRRAAVDHVPKKALRADTREQALALYDELSPFGPFVVQRWVEGGEDSVLSFHCYANDQSRVLGWFVGRKIRTYPKEAGVSTYLELVRDEEVARAGMDIVSRLGIVGPLKIDFKRDERTRRLYVLELNPRFTLWCYLGTAAGVNLPAIAYNSLLGLPLPLPQTYRTDIRWLSFGNDVRTFLRSYRPAGDLGILEWLGSYRSKKVYEVFSWTDPAPSVAKMLDYARRASSRVFGMRRVAEVS
jgi:predicted ATP-grasp superfamily ATP-dependent carboligase